MEEEIKKILDRLKDSATNQIIDVPVMGGVSEPIDNSQCLEPNECKILLDYITNLQEEVNKLTAESTEWESKFYDLQEENERLKELCNKYEEEHSTAFKLWTMKMEEMPCYEEFMNYKSRYEKVTTYYYKTLSEYNKQNKKMPDEAVKMFNLLEGNK